MPATHGQSARLHIARQSAIATFPNTPSEFRPRAFYSSTIAGSAGFTPDPVLGRGTFNNFDTPALQRNMEEVAGDVVFPLCANAIGDVLADVFGLPVTTGASAPFTHTFASGKDASPLMCAAELRLSSSHQRRLLGLVPTGLKLDVAKEASGDTTQRITVSYMGREDQTASTALSGVGTERAALYQSRRAVALLVDGVVAGEVLTASLDHRTGVASVPYLDGTDFVGAIEREQDETCSGSIRFRTNARTWHEMAADGNLRQIGFRWGNTQTGLTITVNARLSKIGQPVEGRGAVIGNVDFMGQVGAASAMLTAQLYNALPANSYV